VAWNQPLNYRRRPSTVGFMLRALYPGFLRRRGRFPALRATWEPARFERATLDAFSRLTGLDPGNARSLLLPQALGFPLLLTLLTDPRLPVPIWGALQIRNHLLLRREFSFAGALRLTAGLVAERVLERNVEIDLHLTLYGDGELAWEGLTTIHYRGRFGPPGPRSPLATAPDAGDEVRAEWRTPAGGRGEFSRLAGDHNGLHWSDRYARRRGHRRALLHPQRALAQALARSPFDVPPPPVRLDAWLKGPVYYGEGVWLRGRQADGASVLAVQGGWETRPAMVMSWRAATPGERLVEEAGP
jgi:hypothetical protein